MSATRDTANMLARTILRCEAAPTLMRGPLAHSLTRPAVKLELQRQLNVVCERTIHVVVEGVVEDREDALRRDRVGRVNCARVMTPLAFNLSSCLIASPPAGLSNPSGADIAQSKGWRKHHQGVPRGL